MDAFHRMASLGSSLVMRDRKYPPWIHWTESKAKSMRYCDITLAYNESSGGIKTYINQKRRYIQKNTSDDHILIIPGSEDKVQDEDRLVTVTVKSPKVPWRKAYRFFWRPDKIMEAFERFHPDVIELGSFFIAPLPAFNYREQRAEKSDPCLVSAYFHTDVADAYFGGPLHRLFQENLVEWSENLAELGNEVIDAVEKRAEKYFGNIFKNCDLVFASGREQIERLEEYGVFNTHKIPHGVDTNMFHPDKRSDEIRKQFTADNDSILFLYGGRLDAEKRVELLVQAFQKLELKQSLLILIGEGPLKEELRNKEKEIDGLVVRDYEDNREKYASILASADVYVTAGPHETFGLSVIEAQACGLPVVGVNAGALPERIPEKTGFLTTPGNTEEFAENMKKAALQREKLGMHAREYVLNEGYDWNSSFEKMIGIYAASFKI
ncbi:MAG: glycosyltransferase [Candidatus Marinimicrobia bacterium]|nr:glycosyltransferase [Candidatus Neomarinimicrobiota bacterium]